MPQNNILQLSNHTYNKAKVLVQIVLPAVSSLYFGLAAIWGLPGAEQVIGTLACFATFFGVILGISTKNYYNSDAPYDGKIVVTEDAAGPKSFSLELDGDPEDIPSKKSIAFKVAPIRERGEQLHAGDKT